MQATAATTNATSETTSQYSEPDWLIQLNSWIINDYTPYRARIDAINSAIYGTWILVFLVLGLIGNFIVLIFMPITQNISARAKIFYVALAWIDACVLAFLYGIEFMGNGMNYLTKGKTSYSAYTSWTVTIFIYTLWDFMKSCSAYFMVVFTGQRAFVVSMPFLARKITTKNTLVMLGAALIWSIIVPCCTTIPHFICRWEWGSCSWNTIAIYLHEAMTFSLTIIPLPIICVCTIIVPVKLYKRVRSNIGNKESKTTSSAMSATEVRNSIATFCVALIYVVFVGYNHLVQLIYYFIFVLGTRYSYIWMQLGPIATMADALACTAYACNGYAYLAVLPNFRESVFNGIFGCKRIRPV